MAPPGLLNTKEAVQAEDKHGQKLANKSTDKVDKHSRDSAETKGFPLAGLSPEIQQMIWVEAIQKPACHTFKIHKSREIDPNGWEVHLHPIPKRYDPSAYRRWKSLLHCTPGDNEKLKNVSFQTGFRRAMINFQPIQVKISGQYQLAAAIDVGTDLVILEFERGATSPSIGWFLHWHRVMNIDGIRNRLQHFRRVAIHYKSNHQLASRPGGPFSCYCPPNFNLGCGRYKACYHELACFLDCFENLEEFYLVVEMKGKAENDWAKQYKKTVREKRYHVAKPEDWGGGTFELSRFFDAKNEYIQHCPVAFFDDLADKVDPSPILRPGGPRELLVNVVKLYRGRIFNEKFKNAQEKRDNVKFGLLLQYPLKEKN